MASIGAGVLRIWTDVDCPRCDAPFQVQLVQVACQVTRQCPVCRCQVKLIDSGAGAHRTIEDIDSVLDDFGNSLGGLFK